MAPFAIIQFPLEMHLSFVQADSVDCDKYRWCRWLFLQHDEIPYFIIVRTFHSYCASLCCINSARTSAADDECLFPIPSCSEVSPWCQCRLLTLWLIFAATSASSLALIPSLPGFRVTFSWTASVSLRWVEEYVNTMEAVARFAQDPWEGLLTQMQQEFSNSSFKSLLQIEIGPREVRNKYLLAALYKAGLYFADPQHGKHNLYVWIHVGNYQVGSLVYNLKGAPSDAANSTYQLTDSDLTKGTSTSPSERLSDPTLASTSGLSAQRSGWASDPDDPRLRVHYEFQDRYLSPVSAFTTFLDAMVTAAQHDGTEPGARLTAFSADRHVSMRVTSILLTWTDLKKALMVLWRFVLVNYKELDLMVFADIDFTIYDGDTFLGQGAVAMTAPKAAAVAEAR